MHNDWLQAVRKLHGHLRAAREAAVERTLPQIKEIVMAPHARTVDEELDEAAEVRSAFLVMLYLQHRNLARSCRHAAANPADLSYRGAPCRSYSSLYCCSAETPAAG